MRLILLPVRSIFMSRISTPNLLSVREMKLLLLKGQTDAGTFCQHVLLDTTGIGGGVYLGAKIGASVGLAGGPLGVLLGGIAGMIFGGMGGRKIASGIKRYSFDKARDNYDEIRARCDRETKKVEKSAQAAYQRGC